MNRIRQAVHDYLNLRRSLGFKLKEPGGALLDFATFMEAQCSLRYSSVGSCLGSTTGRCPTFDLGTTTQYCAGLRAISKRG